MGFSLEMFFQELMVYLEETTIEDDTRLELLSICIRDERRYAKECGYINGDLDNEIT